MSSEPSARLRPPRGVGGPAGVPARGRPGVPRESGRLRTRQGAGGAWRRRCRVGDRDPAEGIPRRPRGAGPGARARPALAPLAAWLEDALGAALTGLAVGLWGLACHLLAG